MRWSERRTALVVVVAVCALALLTAVAAQADGPAQNAVVRIDPAQQTLKPGEDVFVDIFVADVSGLYGADVRLSFDPALLAVQDANSTMLNTQVTLGPLLTGSSYFTVRNEADNTAGTVWVALVQLNPAPPVSGSGVLAHIHFRTLAAGASPITITSAEMADRNGMTIPSTVEEGSITIMSGSDPMYAVRLPIIVR